MPKNIITIPATMNEFTAAPIYTKEKRKVAGYARVSTDREEQQTSYEAQVNYYTDFIQSHDDWEFAGIYTDEGISATSMKHRSGFLSMIDDAMAGKIDLIVTKSVSRFARNTVDSLATIRKLKENGVEVYFEKESVWTFDTKGDVAPSELIQFSDRSTGLKPLGIWAFGQWLSLGGLLFCPEIGGGRAAGAYSINDAYPFNDCWGYR